jgi:serine/threonine protein kinase
MTFPSAGAELPYYVMEFIPHSLEHVVEHRLLKPRFSILVELFRQALDALQHLESLNLVHLDVKEANLLIDLANPDRPDVPPP